jgi:hypothetical protein
MLSSPNHSRHPAALAVLLRGAVAGAIGTAAMDLAQYARYRSGGSESLLSWEFRGVKDWDGAPAPAQVGKRLSEGLFHTELPDKAANTVNNAMHWAYGIGWGAGFALLADSVRAPRARWGAIFGTVVWLTDYAVLPATGLYKPIWAYDAKTLGKDWADHLVYGTATVAAFGALSSAQPARTASGRD